jgi:hypothetical protein
MCLDVLRDAMAVDSLDKCRIYFGVAGGSFSERVPDPSGNGESVVK